jgi:hypothetical protein
MSIDEPSSPSAQIAVTQPVPNFRKNLETVTLTWVDWTHSPIYYTQCKITFCENGDWEASCNARNGSGHSDWDVTGTYSLISTATGAQITELGQWIEDIDHGKDRNARAIGNNTNIRDGFKYLKDGSYSSNFHSRIVRDN